MIKFDHIEGMETVYVQVQGKDRSVVEETGRRLGLEGTYIPHSYIELVQIGHLTEVGGLLGAVGCHAGLLAGGQPRCAAEPQSAAQFDARVAVVQDLFQAARLPGDCQQLPRLPSLLSMAPPPSRPPAVLPDGD